MRNLQAKTYLSLNIEFRSSTFLKKNHLGYVLSLPPNSFFAKKCPAIETFVFGSLCTRLCQRPEHNTKNTAPFFKCQACAYFNFPTLKYNTQDARDKTCGVHF